MHRKPLVSACSEERLDAPAKQHRRHQFVDAELWAGEMLRTVAANPGRCLDDAFLTAGTGLAIGQSHAGISWHNTRAREIQESCGAPNLSEPHPNGSLSRFP